MKRLRLGRVLLCTLAVLFFGCEPQSLPTTSDSGGSDDPSLAIGDGTTTTGEFSNPDFFFKDPLAFTDITQDPDFDSGPFQFVGFLSPTVKICEIAGLREDESTTDNPPAPVSLNPVDDCVVDGNGNPEFIVEFSGPDVTVDLEEEQYQVNWKTDEPALNTARFYRILVFGDVDEETADDELLGFRDVDPEEDPTVASDSGEEYHVFNDDSNVPIKFRIEAGNFCDPDAIECSAALVKLQDGGAVFTESGGIDIPPQNGDALTSQSNGDPIVVVQRLPLGPTECLQMSDPALGGAQAAVDIPVFGPCFDVGTAENRSLSFDPPAKVFACVPLEEVGLGEPALTESQEKLLHIHRADGNGNVEALPNVVIDCLGEGQFASASADDDGFLDLALATGKTLLRTALPWVSPPPLQAGDLGLGGFTRSTSFFMWGLSAKMEKATGDNQQAAAGSAVPIDPVVLVTDAGDLADAQAIDGVDAEGVVENARLHFSVEGPDADDIEDGPDDGSVGPDGEGDAHGSPSPIPPQVAFVTDDEGKVSVEWTLSDIPGENKLIVRGRGIASNDGNPDADGPRAVFDPFIPLDLGSTAATTDAVALDIGELTFTALGCETPTVDGMISDTEWACAERRTFTANLSGGSGTAAQVFWFNDGTDLFLMVQVVRSEKDKANELGFDFDNDGNGGADLNDDVILLNGEEFLEGDPAAFKDLHLTKQCLNKSQSLCGDPDPNTDGVGAFEPAPTNDGIFELSNQTVAVYELKHPWHGADVPEDLNLSQTDTAGFFLTLRLGKGAQGNTQWPGFRNYQPFTIK